MVMALLLPSLPSSPSSAIRMRTHAGEGGGAPPQDDGCPGQHRYDWTTGGNKSGTRLLAAAVSSRVPRRCS